MKGYTFSKREKVLLVLLAAILLVVVWYQVVFASTQAQITDLDNQIATVQDQMVTDSAKAANLKKMEDAIASYKAKGQQATSLPNYDNTQALMANLNAILSQTSNYNLSFQDPELGSNDIVERPVKLSFSCASYDSARAVLNNLTQGGFPCSIESFTITDNSANLTGTSSNAGSGTAKEQPFAVSATLTFYEKNNGVLKESSSSSSSSSSTSTSSKSSSK